MNLVAAHGSHMANTYDFYKPKLDSEYPEVDGPVSITAYISAIDASYKAFRTKHTKAKKAQGLSGPAFSLSDVDYPIFHSPYGKMVQKAHGRLVYNDFLANPDHPKYANVPDRDTWLSLPYKASLTDKNLEKAFIGVAKADFDNTVEKGMKCARRCGNMYTASLYGGLASLLASVEPSEIRGKRISMFAFGSGLASSFFTIKVKGDTTEIQQKLDLIQRLESMKVVPCQAYVDSLTVCLCVYYRKTRTSKLIIVLSSVTRTTTRCRTCPRVLSTTSGPEVGTSRISTASTAASTLVSPRRKDFASVLLCLLVALDAVAVLASSTSYSRLSHIIYT